MEEIIIKKSTSSRKRILIEEDNNLQAPMIHDHRRDIESLLKLQKIRVAPHTLHSWMAAVDDTIGDSLDSSVVKVPQVQMTGAQRPSDSKEQYYTKQHIAKKCVAILTASLDYPIDLIVDPAAGVGAFLPSFSNNFPGVKQCAFDIDPRASNVGYKDFLASENDAVAIATWQDCSLFQCCLWKAVQTGQPIHQALVQVCISRGHDFAGIFWQAIKAKSVPARVALATTAYSSNRLVSSQWPDLWQGIQNCLSSVGNAHRCTISSYSSQAKTAALSLYFQIQPKISSGPKTSL